MSSNIYILIICYLPELIRYRDINSLGYEILSSFKIIVNKNNKKLKIVDIISCADKKKCITGLKKMAGYLHHPMNRGIVYYFGHSDTTPRILNDAISHIFNTIHPSSILYIFSDSCSHPTIDLKLNNQNWVIISGANDKKNDRVDGMADTFTIWGVFPALEALINPTPIELHAFIESIVCGNSNIQTISIKAGTDMILTKKMF